MERNLTIKEILQKNIGPPPKKKRKRFQRWKRVKGYEKYYEVSESGKVRKKTVRRYGKWARHQKKKNLTPYLYRGLALVILRDENRKAKAYPLKKIVADNWFYPPTDNRKIKLEDGNPFNCAVSNMQIKNIKRYKNRKYTDEQIEYIAAELENNKGVYGFQRKLSERLGIDSSVISYIANGRRPKNFKQNEAYIS